MNTSTWVNEDTYSDKYINAYTHIHQKVPKWIHIHIQEYLYIGQGHKWIYVDIQECTCRDKYKITLKAHKWMPIHR